MNSTIKLILLVAVIGFLIVIYTKIPPSNSSLLYCEKDEDCVLKPRDCCGRCLASINKNYADWWGIQKAAECQGKNCIGLDVVRPSMCPQNDAAAKCVRNSCAVLSLGGIIKIENVDSSGFVTIRNAGHNYIDVSGIKLQYSVENCPKEILPANQTTTCKIDIEKCQSGTTIEAESGFDNQGFRDFADCP